MAKTAQPSPLVVFHLVVQMLCVRRVLEPLHVSAILVTKVTDTTAQTLMNVQVLGVTSVTPTLCVPTPRDLMSVAVLKALREMVKPAQQRKNLFVTLLVLGIKFVRILVEIPNVCVQTALLVKTFA